MNKTSSIIGNGPRTRMLGGEDILRYLGGIFLEEMAQLCTVHLKGPGFAGAVNTRLLRKLRFSDLSVWGKKTKTEQNKKKKKLPSSQLQSYEPNHFEAKPNKYTKP